MKRARGALFALALASGCRSASTPTQADAAASAFVAEEVPVPLPAKLLRVPLVRQETSYSCGDSVALAILRYYEPDRYAAAPEAKLYAPLHTTPERGTEPRPIADYLDREPGVHADVASSSAAPVELPDLERAVDRGDPVIVAFQAWQAVATRKEMKPWATDWDDGHYAVVIGYDAKNLYFMDPSTEGHYAYVPKDEFLVRWHDVLGAADVHTQHIAVFVHAPDVHPAPATTGATVAASATIIN